MKRIIVSTIRNIHLRKGKSSARPRMKKAASVYEMYYSYEEPVKKAAGHRILALKPGRKGKVPYG